MEGLSAPQIARRIFLSVDAVKTHIQGMYRRTGTVGSGRTAFQNFMVIATSGYVPRCMKNGATMAPSSSVPTMTAPLSAPLSVPMMAPVLAQEDPPDPSSDKYIMDLYTNFAGFDFSKREREVVPLLMLGLSNPDMAERLGCTEETVKSHLTHMNRKAKTRGRIDLHNKIWRKCHFPKVNHTAVDLAKLLAAESLVEQRACDRDEAYAAVETLWNGERAASFEPHSRHLELAVRIFAFLSIGQATNSNSS